MMGSEQDILLKENWGLFEKYAYSCALDESQKIYRKVVEGILVDLLGEEKADEITGDFLNFWAKVSVEIGVGLFENKDAWVKKSEEVMKCGGELDDIKKNMEAVGKFMYRQMLQRRLREMEGIKEDLEVQICKKKVQVMLDGMTGGQMRYRKGIKKEMIGVEEC